MEKVIYILWRDPATDSEAFAERLRIELAPQLQALGVSRLRINVADAAVAPAAGLRQTNTQPLIETLVQVWVDTAIYKFRKPVDEAIAGMVSRFAAYLVTESQPLVNSRHATQPGQRTAGFAQLALLQKPERLDYTSWLDVWHNSHTPIAIRTQSTFEYIQNVVVRPLTANAPACDAIVEECFPSAAMTDPKVFFNAEGDEARFQKNLQAMMDSVNRFIDFGRIDVLATSQYTMF